MFLQEIVDYIQTAGLGTFGTDLWAAFFPDAPDNIIVVEEYAGRAPEYVQEKVTPSLEFPRFQIRVRDNDYDVGRARIELVYRLLSAVSNIRLDGTWYTRIFPLQQPYKLDLDKNNRHHLAFNAEARKGLSV